MARIAVGIKNVNRPGGKERVICERLWRPADRHEMTLIGLLAEEIPDCVRVVRVWDPGRLSLFLRALWFILPASVKAARGRFDTLEAAASGLPLILAKGYAAPGPLEDGVSGFAAPCDPPAIAAKLDCLAADPDFRRRFVQVQDRHRLHYRVLQLAAGSLVSPHMPRPGTYRQPSRR